MINRSHAHNTRAQPGALGLFVLIVLAAILGFIVSAAAYLRPQNGAERIVKWLAIAVLVLSACAALSPKAWAATVTIAGGATYEVDPPGPVTLPDGSSASYESLTVSREICGDQCVVEVETGTWLRWSDMLNPAPEPPQQCSADPFPSLTMGAHPVTMINVRPEFGWSQSSYVTSATPPQGQTILRPWFHIEPITPGGTGWVEFTAGAAYVLRGNAWEVVTRLSDGITANDYPPLSNYAESGPPNSMLQACATGVQIFQNIASTGDSWSVHGTFGQFTDVGQVDGVAIHMHACLVSGNEVAVVVGADWGGSKISAVGGSQAVVISDCHDIVFSTV